MNENIHKSLGTVPEKSEELSFAQVIGYFLQYRRHIFILLAAFFTGSIIQLIIPLLFQSLVDAGIQNRDIRLVNLIVLAQFVLYVSQTGLGSIRAWIFLHISSRVKLRMLSGFIEKLLRLPLKFYFDNKSGELLQRFRDHNRIESLVTNNTLNLLFGFFNIIAFSVILCFYDPIIFFIFLISNILYLLWILLFFKKRKKIDNKSFKAFGSEQSILFELHSSVQDIKIYDGNNYIIGRWEEAQLDIYNSNLDSLKVEQAQGVGASLINQVSHLLITYSSALLVINGSITLGMLLSISYIIGQMNVPIQQLIGFVRSLQDAKISLERLNEVYSINDHSSRKESFKVEDFNLIKLKDLTLSYPGSSQPILNGINLEIRRGDHIAIVGRSGSGKTTLLKALLKVIPVESNMILIDGIDINRIKNQTWWRKCGVVFQDGYVFNDTLVRNIVLNAKVDPTLLNEVIEASYLTELVNELPDGYESMIGPFGQGLSTGQRQRILIARALYSLPDVLLFDEATSNLDSKSEQIIIENIRKRMENKTLISIAHRLSTVIDADKIIMLENGRIAEFGCHKSLMNAKGSYYQMIISQLSHED